MEVNMCNTQADFVEMIEQLKQQVVGQSILVRP